MSDTWSRPRRVVTVAAGCVAALVVGALVVRTGLTLIDGWLPPGPEAELSYAVVALHGLGVWFGCSALVVVGALRTG
jgi:hypothetical protein